MTDQIDLILTDAGDSGQLFPLRKGLVNVISGVVIDSEGDRPSIVHCVLDGNLLITWNDASDSTIFLTEGDDFSLVEAVEVEVVAASGTFHFA